MNCPKTHKECTSSGCITGTGFCGKLVAEIGSTGAITKSELFTCSGQIRWFKVYDNPFSTGITTLQQLWIGDYGTEQWRNVKIVTQ